MAPNMAIDIISSSDCSGFQTLSTMATHMPRQDTAIAPSGTPLLLSLLRPLGA